MDAPDLDALDAETLDEWEQYTNDTLKLEMSIAEARALQFVRTLIAALRDKDAETERWVDRFNRGDAETTPTPEEDQACLDAWRVVKLLEDAKGIRRNVGIADALEQARLNLAALAARTGWRQPE